MRVLDPITTFIFFNGSDALDREDYGTLPNIRHTMFALRLGCVGAQPDIRSLGDKVMGSLKLTASWKPSASPYHPFPSAVYRSLRMAPRWYGNSSRRDA